MMDMQWYVARTKGTDTRAALYLNRGGFPSFLPKIQKYWIDQRTKRERMRETSLLPGYVFFEATDWTHADRAKHAIGVSYVLGDMDGEHFVAKEIPRVYIETLIGAGPIIVGKRKKFAAGDKVILALAGVSNIIGTVDSDLGGKIRLRINVLGTETLVTADPAFLEAAE